MGSRTTDEREQQGVADSPHRGPDSVSMPPLIMFRHAKSDWYADYADDDRMRPLSIETGSQRRRIDGQIPRRR